MSLFLSLALFDRPNSRCGWVELAPHQDELIGRVKGSKLRDGGLLRKYCKL